MFVPQINLRLRVLGSAHGRESLAMPMFVYVCVSVWFFIVGSSALAVLEESRCASEPVNLYVVAEQTLRIN